MNEVHILIRPAEAKTLFSLEAVSLEPSEATRSFAKLFFVRRGEHGGNCVSFTHDYLISS